MSQAVKKIKSDYLPRQKKYEDQERKLAGRNSYSKTDEDVTFIRMKEDRGAKEPLPKSVYNIQTGTEGLFVVGFSLHQRAGDTNYFSVISGSILCQQCLQHLLRLLLHYDMLGLTMSVHGDHGWEVLNLNDPHGFGHTKL